MTSFIDAHRGQYGVDPICRELPSAPSTYYQSKARDADPGRGRSCLAAERAGGSCGAERAEHPRDTYKLWEEPTGPDFVLEVLSPTTWKADLGPKRALYASLGVAEYWLFDPTKEPLLSPPLRGMRLVGRSYRDLPVPRLAESTPTLRSEVLGLDLRVDRGALRLRDAATGEELLSREEAVAAREATEARVAELEALLEGMRT